MERISEKDIFKEFKITPENLKANTRDEEFQLFLKQCRIDVASFFGVPKYMVRSNG